MSVDREKTFANAEKLLKQGRPGPALEEFRRVAEASPRDVLMLNRIGDVLVHLHRDFPFSMEQNCGGLRLGPLHVIKATSMKSLTKKVMKLWRAPSLERSLARKSRRRPLPLDGETFLLILLNAIGDAIMAQPVWCALKSVRPRVRIALLCRPPIASLLRQDDSLAAILSFEADPGEWWKPRNVNRIEALWQKRRYEVILDFTEIPLTALACAKDTTPPSVGFAREKGGAGPVLNLSHAYDYPVRYDADSEQRSARRRYEAAPFDHGCAEIIPRPPNIVDGIGCGDDEITDCQCRDRRIGG